MRILISTLLLLTPVAQADGAATAWYYGHSDIYTGRHHAAYWNGQTPEGWPDTVDFTSRGIATTDWSVPFGTVICLRVVAVPAWAKKEFSNVVGRATCGTVVDRTAIWVGKEYGEGYDLWPATARRLMGVSFEEIGTVKVEVVYDSRGCNPVRERGPSKYYLLGIRGAGANRNREGR